MRRKTLNSKPVKLRLKIDLVSYPARVEVSINRVMISQFGKLVRYPLNLMVRT